MRRFIEEGGISNGYEESERGQKMPCVRRAGRDGTAREGDFRMGERKEAVLVEPFARKRLWNCLPAVRTGKHGKDGIGASMLGGLKALAAITAAIAVMTVIIWIDGGMQ